MNILGLKLTHDSSISLISDGELKFCVELEKLSNNPRFHIIKDFAIIKEILTQNDFSLEDIDYYVIDGWKGNGSSEITLNNLEKTKIKAAGYIERSDLKDLLQSKITGNFNIKQLKFDYVSYPHVCSHIFSSYCTSPFAEKNESSYILIWDGGMFPRLYYYNTSSNTLENLGPLFYFGVNIYSIFSQHFRPYKFNSNVIKDELSIAGKVMAYTSLGKIQTKILELFEKCYNQSIDFAKKEDNIPDYPYKYTELFLDEINDFDFSDEDIITSFHKFISLKLTSSLKNLNLPENSNLCYAGGAALNIKWNSDIRDTGLFKEIWIPPFPNDSGSSIGAACSHYVNLNKNKAINWDIFSGPQIISKSKIHNNWKSSKCTTKQLAKLIFNSKEPVVVLNNRAEVGPRALGNRSIIGDPTTAIQKDLYNKIKMREFYRPVAPICLEDFSEEIFEPGGKDPYMLFSHSVKNEWREKIPSVVHLDGTARLQTINKFDNPLMYEILNNYYLISGVPILCNSSANFKGSGFFPDIQSAMTWSQCDYIWSDNILYEKIAKGSAN